MSGGKKMKLEGNLVKNNGEKYWGVEIPSLGVFTQGRTRKHCYEMAKEAIELLLDDSTKVVLHQGKGNEFYISSKNMAPLIALVLKRKRLEKNMTIMQVARRLGSKSPTAYARYESGNVKPSLDKLDEILKAISDDLEPILKIG
jgi:predicted RNase H-like HicB family nuclease